MSATGSLFVRVTSFANVLAAARSAVQGKRRRGDVQRLIRDLEPTVIGLADSLRAGAWRPGPFRTFTVCEPKQRLIAAAPLADRVVHHAVCRVIEPLLERRSIHHSYACRRGRGTHAALRRTQRMARRHRCFLKGDVRKFFDSVDHRVLLGMLARVVEDDRLLALVGRIVAHQPPGAAAGKGLPIGNLTSQHLANLYLGALDRKLCRRFGERRYLRYMDDFLVFAGDKAEAHQARAEAASALAGLRLGLNERATLVAPVSEGVPFLGMRVFPGTVRLQHAARSRFLRGWRARLEQVGAGRLDEGAFLRSAHSVFGHLAHASTWGLRTGVTHSMHDGGLRA